MGELKQAKDYHQKAMEMYTNVLGPNHIDVATSYNKLGLVYEALGELEQTKDYHERAMEIWINVLGPNHIKVAASYNNLGSVYNAMGELEQAKDYHEKAMEIGKCISHKPYRRCYILQQLTFGVRSIRRTGTGKGLIIIKKQ